MWLKGSSTLQKGNTKNMLLATATFVVALVIGGLRLAIPLTTAALLLAWMM